jgi:hypothetical protein
MPWRQPDGAPAPRPFFRSRELVLCGNSYIIEFLATSKRALADLFIRFDEF